jgi:hypothetical protein
MDFIGCMDSRFAWPGTVTLHSEMRTRKEMRAPGDRNRIYSLRMTAEWEPLDLRMFKSLKQ